MSAQLRPRAAPARLVLLGTGTVGSAFVARYQALTTLFPAKPKKVRESQISDLKSERP